MLLCVCRRCWTACCSTLFLSFPPRSDTLWTKQLERSGHYASWRSNMEFKQPILGLKEANVCDIYKKGKIHFAVWDSLISVCSDGRLLSFSRILFKDKDRNWDEIENKLRSESETPLLKTSNKVERLFRPSVWLYLHLLDGHRVFSFYQEISSILFELKRVEKQLQGKDTLSHVSSRIIIKNGTVKNQVWCLFDEYWPTLILFLFLSQWSTWW